MQSQLFLGVYRRLDNRFEGIPDDSPRGFELHTRRKNALHDVFDGEHTVAVVDWGQTDDARSHEFVELSVVGVVAPALFQYAVVPGLKYVAEKLAQKAVEESAAQLVKWVISKLRPKQQAKELLDFEIRLPDGTRISVDPPDRNATITISFSQGAVSSINYSTGTIHDPERSGLSA